MLAPWLGGQTTGAPPAEVIVAADLVFRGTVADRVTWMPAGPMPSPSVFVRTALTVQVTEVFKGQIDGEELILRLPGGELEDGRVVVTGSGPTAPGKGSEAMFFLNREGRITEIADVMNGIIQAEPNCGGTLPSNGVGRTFTMGTGGPVRLERATSLGSRANHPDVCGEAVTFEQFVGWVRAELGR